MYVHGYMNYDDNIYAHDIMLACAYVLTYIHDVIIIIVKKGSLLSFRDT